MNDLPATSFVHIRAIVVSVAKEKKKRNKIKNEVHDLILYRAARRAPYAPNPPLERWQARLFCVGACLGARVLISPRERALHTAAHNSPAHSRLRPDFGRLLGAAR